MTQTHTTTGQCGECKDIFTSEYGGHFVQCKCGKSYLDQERSDASYVRVGGEVVTWSQTCPEDCKVHSTPNPNKK